MSDRRGSSVPFAQSAAPSPLPGASPLNNIKSVDTTRIHQIISLIDLTNLNTQCDLEAIDTLCASAQTPAGPVAAICIWPDFIEHAAQILGKHSAIKIATVVNFPQGNEPASTTCTAIGKALKDGATEIDYVLPYNALINGDTVYVAESIQTVRKQIPGTVALKIILETGMLPSEKMISTAAHIAIDHGADFIKTSTGKVPVNATMEAAAVMLQSIVDCEHDVGFKAAGGISSVEQADEYLSQAEQLLGSGWINASHFRFGASSLLQNALQALGTNDGATPTTDGY